MKLAHILVFQLLIGLFLIASWVMNVTRLVKCDFEPSYKAEAIYALGTVTPTFIVTAWIDLGK